MSISQQVTLQSISVNDISAKFKTKREIYTFLVQDC
jgi:hypothetical protein